MTLDNPRTPFEKKLIRNNIRSRLDRLESEQVAPSNGVISASEIATNTGTLIVDLLLSPATDVEVLEPTDAGYTGSFISGPGETFGSDTYHVGGVSAGVLQAGFSSTTGKFISGAGVVRLNADGIEVEIAASLADVNSYKLVDSLGNIVALITGYKDSPAADNYFTVEAYPAAGRNTISTFQARAPSGNNANAYLTASELGGDNPSVQVNSATNDIVMNAGRTEIIQFLNLNEGGILTIAAGVVTATHSLHALETEGAAATDDLDTINGGADGDLLILYDENSARDVTAKDGTGNLSLAGDFVFTNIRDRLTLLKKGGIWVELSRSDNQ